MVAIEKTCLFLYEIYKYLSHNEHLQIDGSGNVNMKKTPLWMGNRNSGNKWQKITFPIFRICGTTKATLFTRELYAQINTCQPWSSPIFNLVICMYCTCFDLPGFVEQRPSYTHSDTLGYSCGKLLLFSIPIQQKNVKLNKPNPSFIITSNLMADAHTCVHGETHTHVRTRTRAHVTHTESTMSEAPACGTGRRGSPDC